MTSLAVCSLLNLNRIRAFDFGIEGLVSIYDDEHFSNSDYDIIEPGVRSDIRRVLLADGWTAKGSKAYSNKGVQIKFPAPSHTLGCNPADKVLEAVGDDVICIVTPTQALLSSIALKRWSFKRAEKLVEHHPANLSKIWNWILNEQQDLDVTRDQIASLKEVQQKGIELRKKGEQNLYPFKKKEQNQ